jgi:hypothetical protein
MVAREIVRVLDVADIVVLRVALNMDRGAVLCVAVKGAVVE